MLLQSVVSVLVNNHRPSHSQLIILLQSLFWALVITSYIRENSKMQDLYFIICETIFLKDPIIISKEFTYT